MKFIKKIFLPLIFCMPLFLASCYNEKSNPLYNSEWIMDSVDQNGDSYVNHLFLNADHSAIMKTYYDGSNAAIVWTGKYKLSSKKIKFNFTSCSRVEDSEVTDVISQTQIIKFYSGDFFYSVANLGDLEPNWKMELIRPKNYFYRKTTDFFGMPMGMFTRQE